jgi:hypothetical protein
MEVDRGARDGFEAASSNLRRLHTMRPVYIPTKKPVFTRRNFFPCDFHVSSLNSFSILCSLSSSRGSIMGGCLRYYHIEQRVPVRYT